MVVEVDEPQIDIVTALSGSGPAFVYTIIDALAKGGVKLGFPENVSTELAIQTVIGAAELMQESKMSAEELVRMVVTPGGTTAAGLAVMEKMKTSESLIAAVEAATKRGQEMARKKSNCRTRRLDLISRPSASRLRQSDRNSTRYNAFRITSIGAERSNQISNASAP